MLLLLHAVWRRLAAEGPVYLDSRLAAEGLALRPHFMPDLLCTFGRVPQPSGSHLANGHLFICQRQRREKLYSVRNVDSGVQLPGLKSWSGTCKKSWYPCRSPNSLKPQFLLL